MPRSHRRKQLFLDGRAVGRTPWSAADALVGLLVMSIKYLRCGSRGTRADQGVRPTMVAWNFAAHLSSHECVRHINSLESAKTCVKMMATQAASSRPYNQASM
jgi:hypothetical protein